MIEYTSYSTLPVILFWLAMAAIWGTISCGIYIENRLIKEQSPTLPTMQYILARLAGLQRRNLQLWLLMSVLLVVCAVNGLSGMTTPRPAPPSAAAAAAAVEKVFEEAMSPDSKKPVTDNVSHPVPAANSLPFSDITEFNEKDSKQQAYLDWLKQRYENWLITYYYLQKCGMADKADFDLIRSSLHKELANLHTETGTIEDNILLAANGSYSELYAAASCTDERIKITKSSYDVYMQQMRQQPASAASSPASAPEAAAPAQTR
jgi:hypothetical protein